MLLTRTAIICSVLVSAAAADPNNQAPRDLTTMDLEQLMNIEVTTVSKHEQTLWRTAAAVHVLTREDIRRSGATSIPEVLRLVPGLQVGRYNSSTWAVSSRGFNSTLSDKLLVLIDGRTVYSPLWSGVQWEMQDTMLDDIERIEVIRGPGATMWGANAVNGVINIITRPAKETTGTLIEAAGGTDERMLGMRHGAPIGSKGTYRVYAKQFWRDGLHSPGNAVGRDDWNALRGGGRLDWNLSSRDALSIQGSVFDGTVHQRARRPVLSPPYYLEDSSAGGMTGGHLLGQWRRSLSGSADISLSAYYDQAERDGGILGADKRDTTEVEFQHRVRTERTHDFQWGLGYRQWNNDFTSRGSVRFDPSERADRLVNFFGQDEIALVEDTLYLTAGAKVEHYSRTGAEFLPSVRLYWSVARNHAAWLAVSRATAVPGRIQLDSSVDVLAQPLPNGMVGLVRSLGNDSLRPTRVIAWEAGYRTRFHRKISLDVASFYNDYARLPIAQSLPPFLELTPGQPHLVIPSRYQSTLFGETYGTEAIIQWAVMRPWKIEFTQTALKAALHGEGSNTLSGQRIEGSSPAFQSHLRSSLDLGKGVESDINIFRVGSVSRLQVPGYTRADVRLGWRAPRGVEFSIVGQDLLRPHRVEFSMESPLLPVMEVKRSVYGKVTWRF